MEQLKEVDALTFAMCILSERRSGLNQEAPMAKKLVSVYKTLEELRDIVRENQYFCGDLVSEKEAIYRHVQVEYMVQDIEDFLGYDEDTAMFLEENRLSFEKLVSDKEMLEAVLTLMVRYETRDHDYRMRCAVREGVKQALELKITITA